MKPLITQLFLFSLWLACGLRQWLLLQAATNASDFFLIKYLEKHWWQTLIRENKGSLASEVFQETTRQFSGNKSLKELQPHSSSGFYAAASTMIVNCWSSRISRNKKKHTEDQGFLIWGRIYSNLGEGISVLKLDCDFPESCSLRVWQGARAAGLAGLCTPLRHSVRYAGNCSVKLAPLLRLLSVYQLSRSKVCRHWVEQQ